VFKRDPTALIRSGRGPHLGLPGVIGDDTGRWRCTQVVFDGGAPGVSDGDGDQDEEQQVEANSTA
jgi:hypothetical protein